MKMGVGILGCGPIAQMAHLQAVSKAANAYLAAVCDRAIDLAEHLGAYYSAKQIYYDYEKMLADPNVDLVIIAVADEYHVKNAISALKAGKHVLVEKPIGISTLEVEQLKVDLVRSNCTLQVGHMKRFDPALVFAHRFIREEIGEVVAMKAWYCDSVIRYDMTDSVLPRILSSGEAEQGRSDRNKKNYFLRAHGSHLVDMVQYMVGPIIDLKASFIERSEINNWFVQGHLQGGANLQLDLTIAIQEDWSEGFIVYGSKGTVSAKIYNPWYHKTAEVFCYSLRSKGRFQPVDNKSNCFQLQLENVVSSIRNETQQIGTNLDEAMIGLKTLLAIKQSAETGTTLSPVEMTGDLL